MKMNKTLKWWYIPNKSEKFGIKLWLGYENKYIINKFLYLEKNKQDGRYCSVNLLFWNLLFRIIYCIRNITTKNFFECIINDKTSKKKMTLLFIIYIKNNKELKKFAKTKKYMICFLVI